MTNEANMEKLMALKAVTRDAEAILQVTAGQAGDKMGELRRVCLRPLIGEGHLRAVAGKGRGGSEGRRQNHRRTSL